MRSLVPIKTNGSVKAPYLAPVITNLPDSGHVFDRVFGSLWGNGSDPGGIAEGAPVDIVELDDIIKINVEVPGVAPDELEVHLQGQTLSLSGEKRDPFAELAEQRSYSERRFGSFRRSIKLPCPVQPDMVKAEHQYGVVKITLQKSEAVRPKRIPVNLIE